MEPENFKTLVANLPAILTSLAAVIGAIGGIILGIFAFIRSGKAIEKSDKAIEKSSEAVESSKANASAIEVVHKATNGQSEKLSELSKAVGFAEGEKSEKLVGEKRASDLLAENLRHDDLKVEITKIPGQEK